MHRSPATSRDQHSISQHLSQHDIICTALAQLFDSYTVDSTDTLAARELVDELASREIELEGSEILERGLENADLEEREFEEPELLERDLADLDERDFEDELEERRFGGERRRPGGRGPGGRRRPFGDRRGPGGRGRRFGGRRGRGGRGSPPGGAPAPSAEEDPAERDYDDELAERYFDEELAERDFDDDLFDRDVEDDELVGRRFGIGGLGKISKKIFRAGRRFGGHGGGGQQSSAERRELDEIEDALLERDIIPSWMKNGRLPSLPGHKKLPSRRRRTPFLIAKRAFRGGRDDELIGRRFGIGGLGKIGRKMFRAGHRFGGHGGGGQQSSAERRELDEIEEALLERDWLKNRVRAPRRKPQTAFPSLRSPGIMRRSFRGGRGGRG
ncbi:hypothetical protein D9611_013637 [Ephemerocybe angulata]|uniref:Uncharacterized protein n=1 Tax=Ephemerocybe angulata TaxID=980116 RepID=A0A8H5ARW2_9AGAR|nr:hypothetical protein D9611_013637 [Tulosesus angulatus]